MKKELTTWSDKVIETANRPKFTEANQTGKGIIVSADGAPKNNYKTVTIDWDDIRTLPGTIVALTGGKGAGKDTAAAIFVERGFKRIAFADEMKDALYAINPFVSTEAFEEEFNRLQYIVDQLGWDRAKRDCPEIRRLMQQYGERIKKPFGRNCWTNVIENALLAEPHTNWVVSDLRFPEERDMIHHLGGHTIRINRKGFEPNSEHISEQPLEGIMYDWDNNSNPEYLRICVDNFLKDIDKMTM